jgi:hypothetical protein
VHETELATDPLAAASGAPTCPHRQLSSTTWRMRLVRHHRPTRPGCLEDAHTRASHLYTVATELATPYEGDQGFDETCAAGVNLTLCTDSS